MSDLNAEVWSEDKLLELLGVDKANLARLIRDEDFPVVRLGNKRAFLAESVYAWLKNREGKADGRGRKPKE